MEPVMRNEETKYYFDSRVRYSETDENMRLSVGSLLDYFQDCSAMHIEDRGVGVGYLRERGLAWVVVSWQIDISRMPVLGDPLRIGTWAYAFQAFFGKRNYTLESPSGEEYARASCNWVLMNMKKGRPAAVGEEMARIIGTAPKLDMPECSRKIHPPQNGLKQPDHIVIGRQDVDTNHHLNNARSVAIASGYLPVDFRYRSIRAEYRTQGRLGDEMFSVIAKTDDAIYVILEDAKGNPYIVTEWTA